MSAFPVKSNILPPTNEDTIGPYYPIAFCDEQRMDLTVAHPGIVCAPRGKNIVVKGRILDRHGELANGVLLEFWQANANGVYRTPLTEMDDQIDPWFTGYTRTRTNDGKFELKTIMPGTSATNPRAPNIALTIFSDGISRVVTQFFFENEDINATDPLLASLPQAMQERLIARHEGRRQDGCDVYSIDIHLAGQRETPFFDDLAESEKCVRTLEIGPTDNTSDQRTPRQPLRYVSPQIQPSMAPFYYRLPTPSLHEADLTRLGPGRPQADGDPIEVYGVLTDQFGKPLRQHLIEFWNANTYGRYTHIEDNSELRLDPNFLGTGRVLTDDEGRYAFRTIRPGAYLARPDINRYRPKHIHFSILGGSSRLVTQMYFPNDPHNDRDPMRIIMGDDFQRNLGAEQPSTKETIVAEYKFDIVVGGRNSCYYEPQ